MKNLLTIIVFVLLSVSCQSNTDRTEQGTVNEKLAINYTGDADVVQFKMFEGLSQVLKQDSVTGDFKGIITIPNLNEAIFTYEIVIHKKDSLGHMVELEPNKTLIKLNNNDAIKKGDRFLWIGKSRNGSYLENEELTGSLITEKISSEFLEEEREITVYTPKEVSSKIPHIYFTDGSVVNSYAPYIDRLISTNRIKPVKLIGIHSSSSNRYEEYVKGSSKNELFRRHHQFFYEEVVNTIETEIENWEGERYLFGFSNGAAFCMHEGINNPNKFEEIIAFSTVDYIKNPLNLLSEEDLKRIEELDPEAKEEILQYLKPIEFKFEQYPRFYLGAGRYEESIFKYNLEFLEVLKENEIKVDFKKFVSGHDYNVWRIEFLEYIETRFKK
jgi:enterochelin esterase-like enzyme